MLNVKFCIPFIVSFLLSPNYCKGQEIDSLNNKLKELYIKVDNINSEITQIKLRINSLESQKFNSDENSIDVYGILKESAAIRSKGHPKSPIIMRLSRGDSVILIDYKWGDWLVQKRDTSGFINEMYLEITKEKIDFEKYLKELKEKEKIEKDIQLSKNRKDEILSRWGNIIGERILNGEIWIGMNESHALESLGRPSRINRSIGSWGEKEQWVYYSLYLYFENGILISYQTSN